MGEAMATTSDGESAFALGSDLQNICNRVGRSWSNDAERCDFILLGAVEFEVLWNLGRVNFQIRTAR